METTEATTQEARVAEAVKLMADEVPEADTTVAEETAATTAPVTPEPTPVKEESDPAIAQGLAAIARREKKAKQELAKERESFLREKSDIEKLKPQLEAFNRFRELLKTDPIVALKAIGVEDGYDDIARAAWAAQMGDQAPKEVKVDMELAKLRAYTAKLEREAQEREKALAEKERIAEERAAVREYVSGMEAHVASSTSAPAVKKLLEHRKNETMNQLLQVAQAVARKHIEEGDDTPPSYDEVVGALEAELQKEAAVWGEILPAMRPGAAPSERRVPTTLTSKSTASPTAPRPEPLTEDERKKKAVELLRQMDAE